MAGDQTACKPGSVPPAFADAAAIPLDRPSLDGSRDLPGRLGPAKPCPGSRMAPQSGTRRPYSVLLQAGLAMPPPLLEARCALTAPFHPCRAPERAAVCFLWRCPWGRPRRALPAAYSPWSPDFPPPPLRKGATARPSGPGRNVGLGGWRVKASLWRSGRVHSRPPGDGADLRVDVLGRAAQARSISLEASFSSTACRQRGGAAQYPSRRAYPADLSSAISRARVSPSATPSTCSWRQCRWKAMTICAQPSS